MRPAESLHRQDIKDVGFEEPTSDLWFDPKRDCTPEDHQQIRTWFEEARGTNFFQDYVSAARVLGEIDPTFQLGKEISPREREHLRKVIPLQGPETCLAITGLIRDIDPTFHAGIVNPGAYWSQEIEEWHRLGKGRVWMRFARMALDFKHADPTFRIATQAKPTECEGMRQRIEECRERGDWRDFTFLANVLNDLDPTFDIHEQVTAVDRVAIHHEYEHYKHGNTYFSHLDFGLFLMAMIQLSRKMKAVPSIPSPSPFPPIRRF